MLTEPLGLRVIPSSSPRASRTTEELAQGWVKVTVCGCVAAAAKRVVGLGAKGLKFNPWSRRPGIDFYRLENSILDAGVASVGAVREAVGSEIDLFIDCNGIFNTAGNAVKAANSIEQYNIGFLEEPVLHENLDAMAYVRSRVGMPVATGERLFTPFAFQQLLERGAVLRGRAHGVALAPEAVDHLLVAGLDGVARRRGGPGIVR